MKVAALQLCASDDPVANLANTLSMVQQASEAGAQFIATPEVTNCVSSSRRRQTEVLALQEDDQTLAAMCAAATSRTSTTPRGKRGAPLAMGPPPMFLSMLNDSDEAENFKPGPMTMLGLMTTSLYCV